MEIHAFTQSEGARFTLKGTMTFRDKEAFAPVLAAVNGPGGRVVTIDLAELEHVDSFGIGLFLLANEQAQTAGVRLNLVNPRGNVARVFELANLDAVLHLKKNEGRQETKQGVGVGLARRVGIGFHRLPDAADGSPCAGFSGRLVFAEHGIFQEMIETLLQSGGPRMVLDLHDLDFMDSAGLSMIMIAREEAEARHMELVLRNPRGPVAQLLNLSALDFMVEG